MLLHVLLAKTGEREHLLDISKAGGKQVRQAHVRIIANLLGSRTSLVGAGSIYKA